MNLVALAPLWLVSALFIALAAAALEDGWRLRISNVIPLVILALAIVATALAGPRIALWQNVALFIALLVVGTFLFSARLLGGGDVKLFASCGLWFDLSGGWRMLVMVAIAGGLLAILILSLRTLVPVGTPRWLPLRPKSGIPYGVAIAAGTAAAIGLLR
ncbi:MAG: prepilin peptidase [Sphingomicrobium sp.]